MKYQFFVLILFGSLGLSGCKQNQNQETAVSSGHKAVSQDSAASRPPLVAAGKDAETASENISNKADSLSFPATFAQFFKIIQTGNVAAFNQYIHPEHSLYIIEQPGAVPQFTQVHNISRFKRTFDDQSFFSIKQEFASCDLKQEPLPTFNCDGQAGNTAGYTKAGCFVAGATAFRKNEAHLYGGLSEPEIKQIESTKLLLGKTVLHTASAYKFHFGYVKNKWYIFFIELIVPCSA